MAIASNLGTVTLTNDIKTFSVNDGISAISLLWVSGAVTYKGTLTLTTDSGTGIDSTPIDMNGNNPSFEMVFNNPVDGLVVDASAGSVDIIFTT